MHRSEQQVLIRHFVEEVGLLFDELGAPRMMGRIVGFLLICDPPHQSSQAIAEYLDASRGAVSTSTRHLVSMGMLERVPVQKERSTFFRMRINAWAEIMRQRTARIKIARELAASGLRLFADASAEHRERLRQFHDFYSHMEKEFQPIIDRWEATHPEEDP